METYINQLIEEIEYSTANVSRPFIPPGGVDIWEVPTEEEEEKTAAIHDLEEWTRIKKEQLPPPEMLSDDQISRLLKALTDMLNAYNWSFILQIQVPERIQYATIRDNFDQLARVKVWHCGYFELCRPGTEHGKCTLGEYCQCAFYAEIRAGFIDEDLTPEEERRRELEIRHLKWKYEDDWMRYYPYHLDPDYDDEDGNPYDYGFGEDGDEDE